MHRCIFALARGAERLKIPAGFDLDRMGDAMKRILLAGLGLFALAATQSAVAADRPLPYKAPPPPVVDPIFNWTGFYIGVNAGYGWSPWSDQLQDLSNGPGNLFNGLSPEGGFGGGQVGFNWQGVGSPWVLGIEADIQASDIRDTFTWTLATSSSKIAWFGTARGRLGFASDRTLIYATGGFAYGHVNNREVGGAVYISDGTASGYAVGGGAEYAFSPALSVKAEYQYINLGKHDPVTAGGVRLSSFPGTKVENDAFHTVRVGLNLRFGTW